MVIPVMVSLALTNAQTGTKIVLVIDYAQIFQVDSGVHAKLDTNCISIMEIAYLVLMSTNAMQKVPTVI